MACPQEYKFTKLCCACPQVELKIGSCARALRNVLQGEYISRPQEPEWISRPQVFFDQN